jgi:pyrimidine-nucleoside phosphorylase
MTPAETAVLTQAMLDSGSRLDLAGLGSVFVDKHSTGGVGDKTSLVLAPLAAALGLTDPMMSGRALGHTGGTLDKLDAIPGYKTAIDEDTFKRLLKEDGFAMTGQSKDVAPADKKLYALRDVTGTVESIPLITASILSKKAAAGVTHLVMDVKYGSGAFMHNKADSQALAESLVRTGTAMGLHIAALLTDMDEPLGRMVGNFLEVEECIDLLRNPSAAAPDLLEVIVALGSRMALLGGLAGDDATARELVLRSLDSGEPYKCFMRNVASQGGDPERLLQMCGAYRSSISAVVTAPPTPAAEPLYIRRIDAGLIGHASVLLGVGRSRAEDAVSPVAGIEFLHKSGDKVQPGDPVCRVDARDDAQGSAALRAALPQIASAIAYSKEKPQTASGVREMVWKVITD